MRHTEPTGWWIEFTQYMKESSFQFIDKPKISNEINKLNKKYMPENWYSSSKVD